MSSVTRSLAIAAILPFLGASSAASAAIPDDTAVVVQNHNSFMPYVPEATTWVMLILGFGHLGVSLRCRAAALRMVPARARRRFKR